MLRHRVLLALVLLAVLGVTRANGETQTRPILKTYFESGDKPTQDQFATLIDSLVQLSDDRTLIGLREYNPDAIYLPGDARPVKRFGIGDTTPTSPLGYVLPTPYSLLRMEDDFAGHGRSFAALLYSDASGANLYYAILQLTMDARNSPTEPPAINAEYVSIETLPGTPVTMTVVPEPSMLATAAFACGILALRRRQ